MWIWLTGRFKETRPAGMGRNRTLNKKNSTHFFIELGGLLSAIKRQSYKFFE
jgi:hypothetical protein